MNHVPVAVFSAALILLPRVGAAAGEEAASAKSCLPIGDVPALARCALARSEVVRRARYEVAAVRGRQATADRVLPANPTVEVAAGRRKTDSGRVDVDRGVELSQQFEVGGQRRARLGVVRAEEAAAVAVLDAAEREVVINVAEASVHVERARAGVRFAAEELELTGRLAEVSAGRAKQGVGAALDEDLALAALVQARRKESSMATMRKDAEAKLALVVGADVLVAEGAMPVQGFVPHVDVGLPELEQRAIEHRQTVQIPLAEAQVARSRVELLRRERIPDLTLSALYKHEDLADVVGGRLSVSLPLWQRNQGAIAEQQARIGQAETSESQAELRVRLEVRAAHDAWMRMRAVVRGIPVEMEDRLASDIAALRNAYARGTMPLIGVLASLRETFAARRAIVDARIDELLSSLELARATASPITLVPTGGRP
jgi:cobalt-zinc-cadmium efflux system outer membrane protein